MWNWIGSTSDSLGEQVSASRTQVDYSVGAVNVEQLFFNLHSDVSAGNNALLTSMVCPQIHTIIFRLEAVLDMSRGECISLR